jgi:mRNA-degrading endonuclease RelE of RelBE toxin-antitoxin system
MRIRRTERFRKDFRRLPSDIQERFEKMLELFLADPRHLSLRVKKMEGAAGIWEFRVSDSYRVTCERDPDGLLLRRVGAHDVLRRP